MSLIKLIREMLEGNGKQSLLTTPCCYPGQLQRQGFDVSYTRAVKRLSDGTYEVYNRWEGTSVYLYVGLMNKDPRLKTV